MRGGVKGQKSRVVTQVRHDGAQRGMVTLGDRVNRFKIFRKLSPQDWVSGQNRGRKGDWGREPCREGVHSALSRRVRRE